MIGAKGNISQVLTPEELVLVRIGEWLLGAWSLNDFSAEVDVALHYWEKR